MRFCSLDYFMTILLAQLRSLPYSLYAIYEFLYWVIQFREPSPKNRSPYSRFLFVREVLLTKFPLWHSCCLDLCNSSSMRDNLGIEFVDFQFDYHECSHFCGATPKELVLLAILSIRTLRIVFLLIHLWTSVFFNLNDWKVEFSTNISLKSLDCLGLNFNPTFHPCPLKWLMSKWYSIIALCKIL